MISEHGIDLEACHKRAIEKANEERDLSFPEEDRNSDPANTLWLRVYWKEYHSMTQPPKR
jgi:hypothetical protein